MKLKFSLKHLSELLYKHYGKNTIILIDEYDVPLDKAFQYGYYREMAALIRGFLGETLKTNDFLQFAVLTGCLRVSRESTQIVGNLSSGVTFFGNKRMV